MQPLSRRTFIRWTTAGTFSLPLLLEACAAPAPSAATSTSAAAGPKPTAAAN